MQTSVTGPRRARQTVPDKSGDAERRRFPRAAIRGGLAVDLRLTMSSSKPVVLLTRGNVADISCGGLKCELRLDVPVGTPVDVRFPQLPAGVSLAPSFRQGRVVRTESPGGLPDRVAIAFTQPLDSLEVSQPEPEQRRRRPSSSAAVLAASVRRS